MEKVIPTFLFLVLASSLAHAQSGGQFQITQTAIASGGGSDSTGDTGGRTFRLEGTIGQSLAGDLSTGPPYSIRTGFWHFFVAPTAAHVSVSGRVLTSGGRAVNRAVVTIQTGSGVTQSAVTNPFGYFRFDSVSAAEMHVLSVRHRVLQFLPMLIAPDADISGLEIIADP